MNWIKENIWFLLFFIWSFPMGYYRSKFRKIVYETDDWKINIKPVLIKEMKGLFGNIFPENEEYLKMRNFYRFYLVVYIGLFLAWRFS
jgi:peroxiredoxin Q/BCP